MDFVKFYIVQLFKSAASRIRLVDKEKEKLLSRLVSKVENSRDLFPDLKTMERVIELEEIASKLISIYRRLNKSHIDLEKISYQFVSDRDAIQSILRRFLQGNYRSGIISRKKPKIVFDDTTFTIYELKEPDVTVQEEKLPEQPKESKIDLDEFLKDDKEDIVAIKKDDSEDQIQISDSSTVKSSFEQQMIKDSEETGEEVGLEIENGIAKKSIEKKLEAKEKETEADTLILPLQFEEEGANAETNFEKENLQESEISSSDFQKSDSTEEKSSLENDELSIKSDSYSSQKEVQGDEEFDKASEITEKAEEINQHQVDQNLKDKKTEIEGEVIENNILESFQIGTTDNLFLDFEKSILQNILDVDDFLKNAVKKSLDEDELFKLIQEAYRCYQLAKELDYEFISELIKVYWLALVAIRDHKLTIKKTDADLVRSTLIVLVSLIKGREIDLEPFMKNHNSLKEKLKQLEYEV